MAAVKFIAILWSQSLLLGIYLRLDSYFKFFLGNSKVQRISAVFKPNSSNLTTIQCAEQKAKLFGNC